MHEQALAQVQPAIAFSQCNPRLKIKAWLLLGRCHVAMGHKVSGRVGGTHIHELIACLIASTMPMRSSKTRSKKGSGRNSCCAHTRPLLTCCGTCSSPRGRTRPLQGVESSWLQRARSWRGRLGSLRGWLAALSSSWRFAFLWSRRCGIDKRWSNRSAGAPAMGVRRPAGACSGQRRRASEGAGEQPGALAPTA